MLKMIKEAGIFIVIAQALLFFIPGEAYVKYVKAVIGIIMIARVAETLLSPLTVKNADSVLQEALDRSYALVESVENDEAGEEKGSRQVIMDRATEEVKEKLNRNPPDDYYVEDISWETDDERKNGRILLYVSSNTEKNQKIKIEKITVGDAGKEEEEERKKKEELKKYYGELLETEPEQIEIYFHGEKKGQVQ